jgi:hypothetical protein
MEMSEVFYTFLITSCIGFILALSKVCYKSKCSTIDLCCIKITRNIEAEVQEDLELGARGNAPSEPRPPAEWLNNEESKK